MSRAAFGLRADLIAQGYQLTPEQSSHCGWVICIRSNLVGASCLGWAID
jgi:hypothetical protein